MMKFAPFPGNLNKEFKGPSGCVRDGHLIGIDCSRQRGKERAWGQEQVPLRTGDLRRRKITDGNLKYLIDL